MRVVDVLDGLEHALAEVALLVAVAQFDGLVGAGAGPARARQRGRACRQSRTTSTSTVGLPRLSRISRARAVRIVAVDISMVGNEW